VNAIYLFLDAHPYLADPAVIRTIKNIAQKAEVVPRMLMFLSHQIEIPRNSAGLPPVSGLRFRIQSASRRFSGKRRFATARQREAR